MAKVIHIGKKELYQVKGQNIDVSNIDNQLIEENKNNVVRAIIEIKRSKENE